MSPSSVSSSATGAVAHAGDENAHALVHLRRGQANSRVLAHGLEHVVDEPLDARRANLGRAGPAGPSREAPDGPCARPSESPCGDYMKKPETLRLRAENHAGRSSDMSRRFLILPHAGRLRGRRLLRSTTQSATTSPSTASAQLLGGAWATDAVAARIAIGIAAGRVHELQLAGHRVHRHDRLGHVQRDVPDGNVTISGTAQRHAVGHDRQLDGDRHGHRRRRRRRAARSRSPARPTLEADSQIRIPYSGTTCLGPVSGTEILGKG